MSNNIINFPYCNPQQQNPTAIPNVEIPPQVLQDMHQQATSVPMPQAIPQLIPPQETPAQAAPQQQIFVADPQMATEIAAQTALQSGSTVEAQEEATGQGDTQAAQEQTVPIPPTDAANYFGLGWFNWDMYNYSKYANRKTGFDNLDQRQAFFPGFYVLGAVSSLGKTTFCHQMADQLAAQGEHVLYFSLEQTQFEMRSKSISRELYWEYQRTQSVPMYSSIAIRNGYAMANHPAELQARIDAYAQSVGDRMRIIAPESPPNIEWVQCEVEDFIKTTGQTPVVIIDYLQIIQPSIVNKRPLEPRLSIDHIVQTLKSLQKRYNLTVLAISSLNRQNYITPIDYESFKESGGIEYTCDCLWGLQLAAIDEMDIFAKEGHIKEKRDAVKKAKAENPRRIQLVCLKNRYGRANYTSNFEYYPQCDVFVALPNGSWED